MKLLRWIKQNRLLSTVILLGSTLSLLTTLPSGSHYCYQNICGTFFWGAHEVDGVWHISLINNAFNQLPFLNPIYAGTQLSGYNLFLDLILSLPVKLGLQADFLYFKLLPLIWLPLFVGLVLKLSQALKKDYTYIVSLFFFLFFGSTFMYVLDIYHGTGYFGLDSFGAILNLTNMQYSFSLVVLLAVMHVLIKMKHSVRKEIFIGILMFINTGLKFYAGCITGVLISTYYIVSYIKDRDYKKLLRSLIILAIFTGIAIITIYNPADSLQNEEPILSLSPLAHSRVMIEDPGKVYLHTMVLARYTLLESGIGPRLIAIETFTVALYLIFNFGTRIIGLWVIAKKIITKKLSHIELSMSISMLFGILMVLLFVQRGQWWNTVQFFYYSLFLSSFFAAEFISNIFKKKTNTRFILATIIVLLTLPYNIGIARNFGSISKASSYISDDELDALHFLRKQPDGIVASTKPPRAKPSDFSHTYQKDTAYISAYSHKTAYFESEVFLQLLGINYAERKAKIYSMNPQLYKDVDYIYSHNIVGLKKIPTSLEKIFKNKEITIYKVHH